MKYKPIKPSFSGCLNCGDVPEGTLTNDDLFSGNFGQFLLIEINGYDFNCWDSDELEGEKLGVLVEKFKSLFDMAESIKVSFDNTIHNFETYEYNKEDQKWYLIEQC